MKPPPAVLVISSQVAAGPVGASAAGPALLSLGVVPIVVPTILLSNHPGHGRPEGMSLPAVTMQAMLERLLDLGFFANCTGVLTGYFANTEQVSITADFIRTLSKNSASRYFLCDPVLGDDDELYVKPEIAAAIRDRLVPLANGLCPNVFEASWLSGSTIDDLADAEKAAHHWPDKDVVVTSIPEGADRLATMVLSPKGRTVVSRPRLAQVPHGTGDFLSGLLAGYAAKSVALADALPHAVEILDRVIAASEGSECLDLARGLRT